MMMNSWMGSDFTNDDLVKENTLAEDIITQNWKNILQILINSTLLYSDQKMKRLQSGVKY